MFLMRKRRLFLIGILFALILLSAAANAGILKVTEEHPFLVNGDWVPAKNLNEGDLLKTADGKSARIKSIKWVPDFVEVFNLESGYFHNFILSDGLVVHNSDAVKLTDLSEQRFIHYTESMVKESIMEEGILARSEPHTILFANDIPTAEYQKIMKEDSLYVVFIGSDDAAKWNWAGWGKDLAEHAKKDSPQIVAFEFNLQRNQIKKLLVRDHYFYSPRAMRDYLPEDLLKLLDAQMLKEGVTGDIRLKTLERLFKFSKDFRGEDLIKNSWEYPSQGGADKAFYDTLIGYWAMKENNAPLYGSFYDEILKDMAIKYTKSTVSATSYSGNFILPEYWMKTRVPSCQIKLNEFPPPLE